MKPKIYIVEDDVDVAELLEFNLSTAGFEVELISNGDIAYEKISDSPPDLVLLDLMLPGMQGTELCRYIRAAERTKDLPVIMITAKSQETDKLIGLDLGADDYIAKPFSVKEVIARVNAVLRRSKLGKENYFSAKSFYIHFDNFEVKCGGNVVNLTKTEFNLLKTLVNAKGRVISRIDLLDFVWEGAAGLDEHTVSVNIKRLRDKLGRCSDCIQTVRGFGYRFNA